MPTRTKIAAEPALPTRATSTGPFQPHEKEALETIAALLVEANTVYERAFFGDRHQSLQSSGDTLFRNLRAGRTQTARLRAEYAPRPALVLTDTKRASELPAPLAEKTFVLVDHDKLDRDSRSRVMEVSKGLGATGWRIKHDFRPLGALVIEGINPVGERLEMSVSPDTIRADIKGVPDAV